MIDPCQSGVAVPVSDPSQVGEARRAAAALADRLGFPEDAAGRLALVVTEAATNLVKHARHGEIVLQVTDAGGVPGVAALAVDHGPGMADVGRCFEDGYSTAGSPGTGLGAIRRLAHAVHVLSAPATGTVLAAQVWSRPPQDGAAGRADVFAVSVPVKGEACCGDAWAARTTECRTVILVADGLGHGPAAADAARGAVRAFEAHWQEGPAEILRRAHGTLRATRGAAVAVAEVRHDRGTVRFAGVGNIAGAVLTLAENRHLTSHNGTVGAEMRKVQEFEYPWPPGALLLMHSDGLGSHWRLDRYAGLALRPLPLIVGALYRDFKRGRDDVTVLAARERDRDGT